MRLPTRRTAVALALAGCIAGALLLAIPAAALKPEALTRPEEIAVKATQVPFDRDRPQERRFGKLVWRGTLELTSPSRGFGGYSGIALNSDGTRLIAVSDAGSWLTARILYADGRAGGLAGARIGPLLDRDGKPLEGRGADAESLTLAQGGAVEGEAYISFERKHRIVAFPVKDGAVGAAERSLPLPPEAKEASANGGIEAITVLRAGPAQGALLALTEDYLDEAGNHIGWLIGGSTPGRLAVKRLEGFAVTDAASLPNGDVVILERRFRFTEGVKMRLRRIKASDIRAGALLEGEILLAADDLSEIDNMEGLAAHRGPDGRTVLTLVSDNNFNPTFQRTLLMQFDLPEN